MELQDSPHRTNNRNRRFEAEGGNARHRFYGLIQVGGAKIKWWMVIAVLAMGLNSPGQVTNLQAETNSIRLEWTAIPGNPYRVYATPDLVEPAWANLTPAGTAFADAQGFHVAPMGDETHFYCVLASDYMIVDLSGGPSAPNYPVSYTNAPPDGGWTDEYKTTKLALRRIPGGAFAMGSPTNELGRWDEEVPHAVTLSKDYYIGVFEVTQRQWERVMGYWPSYFTNALYREFRPVERVAYHDIRGTVAGTNWPADGHVDADSFLGRLRTKTGQAFDLPTEAQWERACRSETTTALNSGFDLTNLYADVHMKAAGRYAYNGGSTYTANSDTNSGSAKVGSYQPGPWGLYDMHGNVWEWCLDWHGDYSGAARDPAGAVSGSSRTERGGGFNEFAAVCRSANRSAAEPDEWYFNLGFRLAETLP